ncbi:MAG: 3-dehydroquinate dehydratase [Propionibacteriaceae bacterium]|nr:3-dehydroquinate dehydratase [Propionibacteriaceae bacterium]
MNDPRMNKSDRGSTAKKKSARTVMVLNGPNIGRLGKRNPEMYGLRSYDELAQILNMSARDLGVQVDVRQTDSEAEMISWLHEAADGHLPVILNPGAWTHYSYAVADAAEEIDLLVEVHLSNIYAREEFRHKSVISPIAIAVIAGLGLPGYDCALGFIAGFLGALDGKR